jgi:hypothetical protein
MSPDGPRIPGKSHERVVSVHDASRWAPNRLISLYFPVQQGFRAQRRLRLRLPPPPTSLRLQRLFTRHPRPSRKLPRFRGVLGEGHSRIGTGDGEFRADSGQRVAFVSVADFGGPDSLPIRPTGKTGSSNSIRSAT